MLANNKTEEEIGRNYEYCKMMAVQEIKMDYPTLTRWIKGREDGKIHGEILAHLDALLDTALRYDDQCATVGHMRTQIDNLMRSIQYLNEECTALRRKSCRDWTCEERKK